MRGLIWIVCLLTIFTSVLAEEKPLRGPYKTTTTSIYKCSNTSLPLMSKNPTFIFNTKLVNTSKTINAIVATFTTTRSTKNVSASILMHKWENGNWIYRFALPVMSCKSPLSITAVAMMTNVKFDPVDCGILKGNYKVDVDLNVLDHLWTPTREYGRMRWTIEFYTKRYTITCFHVESIVEPIKDV